MTTGPPSLANLAEQGFAIDHDRVLVPEPVVKDALRSLGVRVPRGVVVGDGDFRELTSPLAVKAFGPGIVHKSDIGALRLGTDAAEVDGAIQAITAALSAHGLVPSGFLVEEQREPTVEVLVGAVRTPLGVMMMLALGGLLAEALDTAVMQPWPVTRGDVDTMLERFPARAVLESRLARVARDELVDAILAVSTLAGVVGDQLADLECNPVAISRSGAWALDARLLLQRAPPPKREPRNTDFTALFAPRSVAVVGASADRETFGNRFLAAYTDAGWQDHLYALHPSADRVEGIPAYPSLGRAPGGAVDYLVVAVPAPRCAEVVAGAAARARFIHVISGGFAEAGREGEQLEGQLREAVVASGARVLGPNCMGVFAPSGRQTFLLGGPRVAGTVGVISQSGALAGDIVKGGDRRGIRFSKLVTIGNAIDVTAAELLDHLVDDPTTAVIGLYLEGTSDGQQLVDALRRAAGRKPVVIVPAGGTVQGAAAVRSHTGALAAEPRLWAAVAAATGSTIVQTLEDLLAVLAFAQRYGAASSAAPPSVLVVGPGGGASVLATDACDRHELKVTPVGDEAQRQLRELGFGAGTSIRNPIEIPVGPAADPGVYDQVLTAVLDRQPFSDLLLHINVQSFFSYAADGLEPLLQHLHRLCRPDARSRSALVLRNLDCAPTADLDRILGTVAKAEMPFFRTFDEAAAAIAGLQAFARHRSPAVGPSR